MDIAFLPPPSAAVLDHHARRLKFLAPTCGLARAARATAAALESRYGSLIRPPRNACHIELLHTHEPYEPSTLSERALQLEGTTLAGDEVSLVIAGKALVIPTPPVTGYGPTHCTVAYFPGGVPSGAESQSVVKHIPRLDLRVEPGTPALETDAVEARAEGTGKSGVGRTVVAAELFNTLKHKLSLTADTTAAIVNTLFDAAGAPRPIPDHPDAFIDLFVSGHRLGECAKCGVAILPGRCCLESTSSGSTGVGLYSRSFCSRKCAPVPPT